MKSERSKGKVFRPASLLIGIMWMVLAAGGCYRSPDTTWYEPHVYKGSQDPLLSKLQESGLQQQLEKRFQAVQTDR